MDQIKKPRGWYSSGKGFYSKSSQYGQKYMCVFCGKVSLGFVWGDSHKRMHKTDCPIRKEISTNEKE